jgi:hypothetical protein
MKNPIEQEWLALSRRVYAKASATQRQECRRAFYAGAIALFHMLTSRMSEGEEPTAADLALMDTVNAEFEQYAEDLKAGRA